MKTEENLLIAKLIFVLFKNTVIELSQSPDGSTIGYYTHHGASHFQGVEDSVMRILQYHRSDKDTKGKTREISELEKLILRLCAWSHDVGMLRKVAEEYHADTMRHSLKSEKYSDTLARKNHDNASSWFLVNRFNMLCRQMLDGLAGRIMGKSSDEYIGDLITDYNAHQDSKDSDALKELLVKLKNEQHHADFKAQFTNIAYAANIISRFHRRAEEIEKAPPERYILEQPIRTRLLAAIFRLADAMDVDRSRFIRDAYESYRFLEDFDAESRLHWMKSFIASSITINPAAKAIEVQVDVPSKWTGSSIRDPKESSYSKFWELVNFIESDLEEDVLSISKIMSDHNFPVILGVEPIIHEVPAMEFSEDLWATIDTLAGASSPSTSALIRASLDGLDQFCQQAQSRDVDDTLVRKLINVRLESIKDQLEKRLCHEGLWKILFLVQALKEVCLDDKADRSALFRVLGRDKWNDKKLFIECIRYARHTFLEQRDCINHNIANEQFDTVLNCYGDIILYGYSDQVISLLENALKKAAHKPLIHVLECRTKTKFTRSHRLIYHDAHRYATALRRKLGSKIEISIYGDAAVARILQKIADKNKKKAEDESKTLVFLGSNSILADGAFVHSMGHLSVAAAAKCPLFEKNVTVAVTTDGMKISRHRKNVLEESERNEDDWLSPDRRVLNDLKNLNIKTINYREDHVPPELIDKILVLDTGKCIDLRESDQTELVIKQYFNAPEKLSNKLKHRILASMISEMGHDIWKDGRLDKDARFTGQLSADEKNWKLAEIIINGQIDSNIASQPLEALNRIFHSSALDIAISEFGKCLQDQFEIIEKKNSSAPDQN